MKRGTVHCRGYGQRRPAVGYASARHEYNRHVIERGADKIGCGVCECFIAEQDVGWPMRQNEGAGIEIGDGTVISLEELMQGLHQPFGKWPVFGYCQNVYSPKRLHLLELPPIQPEHTPGPPGFNTVSIV